MKISNELYYVLNIFARITPKQKTIHKISLLDLKNYSGQRSVLEQTVFDVSVPGCAIGRGIAGLKDKFFIAHKSSSYPVIMNGYA